MDIDNYDYYSDERLQVMASEGDRQAEELLAARYSRLVRVCARPYFLAGGDSEDLTHEGMLGLLSAIREYDPDEKASFRTYAELCIHRGRCGSRAASSLLCPVVVGDQTGGKSLAAAEAVCLRCFSRTKDTADRHNEQRRAAAGPGNGCAKQRALFR